MSATTPLELQCLSLLHSIPLHPWGKVHGTRSCAMINNSSTEDLWMETLQRLIGGFSYSRVSTIPNWWCRISLAHPQGRLWVKLGYLQYPKSSATEKRDASNSPSGNQLHGLLQKQSIWSVSSCSIIFSDTNPIHRWCSLMFPMNSI